MDNNAIEFELPVTLEQAMLLSPSDWPDLGLKDVLIDPQTLERTTLRWLRLRGVALDDDPSLVARVRAEVARDPELWIALNLPATDLLTWLRRQDWEAFDGLFKEVNEDDPFASAKRDAVMWSIVDRVRDAVGALGVLAAQRAV